MEGKSIITPMKQWMAAKQKEYVVDVIEKSGGNVSKAAKAAGVNRTHFHKVMQAHGVHGFRVKKFKESSPKKVRASDYGNAAWRALGY